MGQLLSHPIQEKQLDYHSHSQISYAVGLMQGYRITMEDAHSVMINEDESLSIFAVFDGHGGRTSADYVEEKLPRLIFKRLQTEMRRKSPTEATSSSSSSETPLSRYMKTIKNAFFQVDAQLHHETDDGAMNCGTTAILASIVDNKYIIAANTGDSRCIMLLKGGIAKTLLFDHKPVTMGERMRIENSGGFVMNNRVNEILALSRAFGDYKFKLPFVEPLPEYYYPENRKYFTSEGFIKLPPELGQVTVEPEILVYDLQQQDQSPEFIVLACDGIWDCYSNRELIKVIRSKLQFGWSLTDITELILNNCIEMANNITGIGFDNMTLILVAVHPKETIQEWYDRMKETILKEKGVI